MKNRRSLFLFTIVGFLAVSCGGGHSEKSAYDQLMALHDQTMAKMDAVYKLKQQLTDSLKRIKDSTSARAKDWMNRVEDLNVANKTMMDWMHEFKPKPDTLDEKALNEYYSKELEKMKAMKKKMEEAIANAEKSLKQ